MPLIHSNYPVGHFEVSESVRTKCPTPKCLICKGMRNRRTLGHFKIEKPFTHSACVRVRMCVRAYTYNYQYLVSEVSMCPKPYCHKGLFVGHLSDTSNLVSEGQKEGLR